MPLLHCNILKEFKYRKKSIIIWKLNPGEKEKDLDRVRQLEKGRLLPKKSLFLSDGYISTNSVINFTWFIFITLGCEEKLEKKRCI